MIMPYERVLFYIYLEGLWNNLGQDNLFPGWDANAGGSWFLSTEQKYQPQHYHNMLRKELYLWIYTHQYEIYIREPLI